MTMNDTVWQIRAEMALAVAAKNRTLITYAELADAAAIPSPHRINKLSIWLEGLMQADHADGLPLRAVWVISRTRGGLPAPGFFIKCKALGLYDGPSDGAVARAFHLGLLGFAGIDCC